MVQARHPVVPNPYTIMSRIPPECEWFSVINLKDAFWTCPLYENSRDIFAFEWEDPNTGRRQQLRWTVLPQGFSEAPNLFGQSLETVMCKFDSEEGITILQYVDDLLIAGKGQLEVEEETVRLLNFLGEQGLRVSKNKLQFVEKAVKYLGHIIRKDPAQFLFGQKETEHSETEHKCLDVIDYQTKVREDLMDVPIKEGMHLFTDGSLKVIEEKRKSGYAVVDGEDFMVIESRTLLSNWSAQACELGENMKKWDGEPISKLEARVKELKQKEANIKVIYMVDADVLGNEL
ncbi:hypothetical protein BTVI_62526 [Pitangus sulphuratus]|nr:hypothetical protein BTVI_62526 [Pitangus sulphuratus]